MKLIMMIILAMTANAEEFKSKAEIEAEFKKSPKLEKRQKSGQKFYVESGEILPKVANDRIKKEKKSPRTKNQKCARKNPQPVNTSTDTLTPDPPSTPVVSTPASPVSTPEFGPTPAPSTSTQTGVDLRSCDTYVKSQNTPYCTAYGTVAALQNLLCIKDDLSENHVFSMYGVYSIESAASKVPGKTITTIQYWPRTQDYGYKGYLDNAKRKVISMPFIGELWSGSSQAERQKIMDKIRAELRAKHALTMALKVPKDMADGYATIKPTSRLTSGEHVVAAVGYEDTDAEGVGGMYIIQKNSWGAYNGDKGYHYYPISLCWKTGSYCYFNAITKGE